MAKTLFVGGTFDELGGKKSKLAETLFYSINLENATYHNGGAYSTLDTLVDQISGYTSVFWFPNVSNEKTKIIKRLKLVHPESILVSSKRNIDKQYSFTDLVSHALGNKSNLFVELIREEDKYAARVIDPLGNVFLDYCKDFALVARVLKKRVGELISYTRVKSEKIGDAYPVDASGFCRIITPYAETFSKLINPQEAPNRFMGNASFRCTHGFPSFRKNKQVFVSKRNVDKKIIASKDFVAVQGTETVNYFGDAKPSVDTPIQLRLYDYYPDVNYMLHAHVYIKDAAFTDRLIPCGAIEEVDDITKIFPDRNSTDFAINLKGHGSIVFAAELNGLKGVTYTQRRLPEIHDIYSRGEVQ